MLLPERSGGRQRRLVGRQPAALAAGRDIKRSPSVIDHQIAERPYRALPIIWGHRGDREALGVAPDIPVLLLQVGRMKWPMGHPAHVGPLAVPRSLLAGVRLGRCQSRETLIEFLAASALGGLTLSGQGGTTYQLSTRQNSSTIPVSEQLLSVDG